MQALANAGAQPQDSLDTLGCGEPVGDRVQLQEAVLLRLEVGVVRALPAPQGLKADAFLAQQLPQPFVGDVGHHPLGDQVVGQLGQAPGRKRLPEVGGDAQGNPLDLLPLGQGEGARAAAAVARIQESKPSRLKLWITSRTVSGSLKTTSAIRAAGILCGLTGNVCRFR